MKYTYAYKTSDGTRHEASIDAPSREAAFAALREQGIRAIKVTAADGSKANGEVRGFRKRSVTLIAVTTALVAVAASYLAFRDTPSSLSEAKPMARQQIIGMRDRIDEAKRTAFDNPAERFLAGFAEPGRPFDAPETAWPTKAEFDAVLGKDIRIASDEFSESIDLKRIVAGMKVEMSAYLDGGGFVSGYIRELIKRQQTEINYRNEAVRKLTELLSPSKYMMSDTDLGATLEKRLADAYDYWLKSNAQLQALGIEPLALPGRLRSHQLKVGFGE